MAKEISVNDRFEGVRVMLRLTKKQVRDDLGVGIYTYNEVSMGRKDVPSSWLNYMYVVHNVNTEWILRERGSILC